MTYKYFQTDDRDDYFATLNKNKPNKPKCKYNIIKDDKIIKCMIYGYNGITFTKTLINKSRKELSNNNWIKELELLGYIIERFSFPLN